MQKRLQRQQGTSTRAKPIGPCGQAVHPTNRTGK